jgi:hypothetical protein
MFVITGSIWLSARELDDLGPLLGFISDELAELGRRAWKHRAAQVGKPDLYVWIGRCRVDILVESVDDLDRRVLGRANAIPPARYPNGGRVHAGLRGELLERIRCESASNLDPAYCLS